MKSERYISACTEFTVTYTTAETKRVAEMCCLLTALKICMIKILYLLYKCAYLALINRCMWWINIMRLLGGIREVFDVLNWRELNT